MRTSFLFRSLIAALVCGTPVAASAHPESGLLPDAVAEMEYRMVVDLNPADLEARNRLGTVLVRKKKLREAEAQFREVLRRAPANFDGHDGIGLVRMAEGKYAEAADWFARALQIKGDDSLAHYNRGICLQKAGYAPEALREFRSAVEVNESLIRRNVKKDVEMAKTKMLKDAYAAAQRAGGGR